MLSKSKKIEIIKRQINQLDRPEFNFRTWLAESKNLLDLVFTDASTKKNQLEMATRNPVYGLSGIIVGELQKEWRELIKGYLFEIELLPDSDNSDEIDMEEFINTERIQEIKDLSANEFDFTRLVALCKELNSNYSHHNYLSVAILGRSILDHIPPIFGFTTFNEVENNYGSKSFKKNMEHLNKSMRSIADTYLHQTIRKKEVLPNKIQINFSRELDVLLAEIIRICL